MSPTIIPAVAKSVPASFANCARLEAALLPDHSVTSEVWKTSSLPAFALVESIVAFVPKVSAPRPTSAPTTVVSAPRISVSELLTAALEVADAIETSSERERRTVAGRRALIGENEGRMVGEEEKLHGGITGFCVKSIRRAIISIID